MHLHKQPSPDCLVPIESLAIASPAPDRTGGERSCAVVELVNDAGQSVSVRALPGGVFHVRFNRAVNPLPRRTPDLPGAAALAGGAVVSSAANELKLHSNEAGGGGRGGGGGALRMALDRFAIGLSIDAAMTGSDDDRVDLIALDASQINGFNGDVFGLGLRMPEDTPYYGFGERTGRLNKHGARMKFWTVDVCADHPYGYCRDDYDPTYVAIPVAIWNARNTAGRVAWGAVLIDNAGPTWFNIHTKDFLEDNLFYFGSYIGEPSFYFLTGSTLAEVCRNIIALTGQPAMPPLWSLGHHQCRWGYDEQRMYQSIVRQYIEHDIPLSSLWLDIDYMQDYRVFTWNPERVADPRALTRWMHEYGVKLTTIIDPGVARNPGDSMYDEGAARRLFCVAPSGREFVGKVWPGKTVFPDYSLAETRKWWAEKIADHLAVGVDGIWNDMNDPAAGAADLSDMLFERGEVDHAYYHNLYGNFMAEATWDGFRSHDPSARPFILTRSAATGIQRHAAVWTGDNCSSWKHLRMSIPEGLNLSLSGVSFNGPDIGGFMGDTTSELLVRWYQAALLFPFFRNHSCNGTAHQEPWCFGTATRELIREAIILRYRLIGYLYTEFARHVEGGEPVMRPLCYFDDDRIYRDIDDEYAIGGDVIVAPVLHEGVRERSVILPPGRWFDVTRREWRDGGAFFIRETPLDDFGLFIREGTMTSEPVPPTGSFVGWSCDLTQVSWRLHVFGAIGAGEQLVDDGRAFHESAPALSRIRVEAGGVTGDGAVVDRIESVHIYGAEAAKLSMDGFIVGGMEHLLPAVAGGRRTERGIASSWRRST